MAHSTRLTLTVASPHILDVRSHLQLDAFARYCAARIDRELGPRTWEVSIMTRPCGFACVVRVTEDRQTLGIAGVGLDPSLALWNAMCRIEEPLRERSRRRRAA